MIETLSSDVVAKCMIFATNREPQITQYTIMFHCHYIIPSIHTQHLYSGGTEFVYRRENGYPD